MRRAVLRVPHPGPLCSDCRPPHIGHPRRLRHQKQPPFFLQRPRHVRTATTDLGLDQRQCAVRATSAVAADGLVRPAPPPRRPLRSTGGSTRQALHFPARATDCTPEAMNCCPSGMSSMRSAINSTQSAMSFPERPMNSTRSAINSTQSPINCTRRPMRSTQSAMSSTWRPIDSTRSGTHWCLSGTHSTQTPIDSTLSAMNAQ